MRSQDLKIKPQGDWAEVELHEVYQNQTDDVEEILYYFSLPESAVITGLWLGDTADLGQRFTFQVSPRGAAQKVYKSQVRRQRPVDPALLEQVGPRNYRLRAFPVPPRSSPDPDAPQEMHLWLTYLDKVMAQEEGWPLPRLTEKRNIFWTRRSQRQRDGQAIRGDGQNWLPAFIPISEQPQPQEHALNLEGYHISAQPLDVTQNTALPKGQRFALILDTSRSMEEQGERVRETWQWLQEKAFADSSFSNGDVDLYLTAAGGKSQRLDDIRKFQPRQQTFYGSLRVGEMLQQFEKLQGETAYQGIILLTDASNYELTKDGEKFPSLSVPLWIVNLGQLAPAYSDELFELIKVNQGGVATELPELFSRLGTQARLGSQQEAIDNYRWSISEGVEEVAREPGFAPLATRQLIRNLSRVRTDNSLAELDAIHKLAKTQEIVTPYSSMIVLVNNEQRQALKAAEGQGDRFARKIEDGQETLDAPNNPLGNDTNVPEPEMIIGTILMLPFLFLFYRLRKKAKSSWGNS